MSLKTISTLLFGLCLAVIGCSTPETGSTNNADILDKGEALDLQGRGYELLKSTCYVCHNPNTKSHDEILAPPFAGIKMRYQRMYGSREDFLIGMSHFLSNPSQESAIMRGAVSQFGVMSKLDLTDTDIQLIVEFIYDNDLETPDWFEEHSKEMHGN